jgi:hypothetical protein
MRPHDGHDLGCHLFTPYQGCAVWLSLAAELDNVAHFKNSTRSLRFSDITFVPVLALGI